MTDLTEAAIHIGIAAQAAWGNSLVGHASPRVLAYYQRASNPQPGDLVIENSSFLLRLSPRTRIFGEDISRGAEQCVGWLIREEREFRAWNEEDWSEDHPGRVEHCYYIQPYAEPEAQPVRWVNADFIAVPTTYEELRAWEDPPFSTSEGAST